MNTLKIISDNYRQFTLITPENINFYNFPDNWKLIFHAENFSLQKEIVIELWNSIFEKELSRTISFITQNLISIKFIETGFGISMVYIWYLHGIYYE